MNIYYVYAHVRKDSGKIFYVGKGSGNRVLVRSNRNSYWNSIALKHGFIPKILEANLTEKQSYEREIYYIKLYKDLGQCECNFTLGGDGVNVEKRWWSDKISKSLKGIYRGFGENKPSYKDFCDRETLLDLYVNKKLGSVEIGKMYNVSYATVCERLKQLSIPTRNSGRENKKIMCTDDDIVFDSINDAAKHYGLFRENIRKVLSGKYNHTGNKKFKYYETNISSTSKCSKGNE